ncbi:late histone H2B.L1 [Oryctolagus cuniculus]|uniref:late histone H2B.L1 n=1 Tax=Oryctolagus cuniculus TaxID=9986 RepID=UPI0001CE1B2A|nr:late histone H2B.L4 [Oryctolagus cuniculus]
MAESSTHPTSEDGDVSLAQEKAPSPTPKQKTPRRRRRRRSRRCSRSHSCPDQEYSFAAYFTKVLKQDNEDLSLSREAKSLMDVFLREVFERIVNQAARLVQKKNLPALTQIELQSVVQHLLPGELSMFADTEGTKALLKYKRRK